MREIPTPSLWNNPKRVLQNRALIFAAPPLDRNLSQAPALPKASAQSASRGIPTGIYIAAGVTVAAVIGIIAL